MIYPCDKQCGNKTASGYCATTACINPQYSNLGTAQYGQGVQKRIITNADHIRSMTDEELAKWLSCPGRKKEMFPDLEIYIAPSADEWLDWLRQEAGT